jgi:hypothetical protein
MLLMLFIDVDVVDVVVQRRLSSKGVVDDCRELLRVAEGCGPAEYRCC